MLGDGRERMTLDTAGDSERFWAHQQLVRETFADSKLLNPEQFDAVAWKAVYERFHLVPWMFQLWACKQMWNMVGTYYLFAQ